MTNPMGGFALLYDDCGRVIVSKIIQLEIWSCDPKGLSDPTLSVPSPPLLQCSRWNNRLRFSEIQSSSSDSDPLHWAHINGNPVISANITAAAAVAVEVTATIEVESSVKEHVTLNLFIDCFNILMTKSSLMIILCVNCVH